MLTRFMKLHSHELHILLNSTLFAYAAHIIGNKQLWTHFQFTFTTPYGSSHDDSTHRGPKKLTIFDDCIQQELTFFAINKSFFSNDTIVSHKYYNVPKTSVKKIYDYFRNLRLKISLLFFGTKVRRNIFCIKIFADSFRYSPHFRRSTNSHSLFLLRSIFFV